DGYGSAWQGELRVRFVVFANEGIAIRRHPARRVREKHMQDGDQPLRVFTWAQPAASADMALACSQGKDAAGGGMRMRSVNRRTPSGAERAVGPGTLPVTSRSVKPDLPSRSLRDYADLLLTCYDGYGRLIAGFNVVEQRN